ncbi:hypothetical protein EMEDMD4_50024 [Sinorhizobium medicae]|uniref:Uncharacterized protein n=1 Tax=Sinorhizobium medicae TaxID=110321 RepID=A0A508X1H7_9HYPH|nr:hypothetical protein EMEDMD4_50024 [Sinorhizobium medicae]
MMSRNRFRDPCIRCPCEGEAFRPASVEEIRIADANDIESRIQEWSRHAVEHSARDKDVAGGVEGRHRSVLVIGRGEYRVSLPLLLLRVSEDGKLRPADDVGIMRLLHRHQAAQPFGSGDLVIVDEGNGTDIGEEVEGGRQPGVAGMCMPEAPRDGDDAIEGMAAEEVLRRLRTGKPLCVVFDDDGRQGDVRPLRDDGLQRLDYMMGTPERRHDHDELDVGRIFQFRLEVDETVLAVRRHRQSLFVFKSNYYNNLSEQRLNGKTAFRMKSLRPGSVLQKPESPAWPIRILLFRKGLHVGWRGLLPVQGTTTRRTGSTSLRPGHLQLCVWNSIGRMQAIAGCGLN